MVLLEFSLFQFKIMLRSPYQASHSECCGNGLGAQKTGNNRVTGAVSTILNQNGEVGGSFVPTNLQMKGCLDIAYQEGWFIQNVFEIKIPNPNHFQLKLHGGQGEWRFFMSFRSNHH